MLREHTKGPRSQRLIDEVAKLAQAHRDARPAAAPKKEMNSKTKSKIDQVLALEAKASKQANGDGFTRVTWKNKKEKFLWERDVCDAESIIHFGDDDKTPAPRLRTQEDGASGYQLLSAGKLAEAMTLWYHQALGNTPFLVISPAARAFNTSPEQWRLWVARFSIREVSLFFIDPADPAAVPKEERCFVAQFGNEHVCLDLDDSATKAVGETAEYQVLSVQLPLHHFPNHTEAKLKSQFADIALRAVGPSNVYKGRIPKQTGVIQTSFRDEQVTVVQGLVSVTNDRMHQALRRSGQEGAIIRMFRMKDPFQISVLPMENGVAQARKISQACGEDSFGIVMTRKGYAIRVSAESRSSVDAQIHSEVAECLGDAFHQLQAVNPNALEFVVSGLHGRMTRVQMIQSFMDSLGWAINPVKPMGPEIDNRRNWLVRALVPPRKIFT